MAKHKSKDMETILAVYNTKDAESASLALLKADIECVRRKIGAGKYGNFLLALNNYGEEILVRPTDAEKAGRILDEWRAQRKLQQKQEPAPAAQAETDSDENSRENNVLWARILAGIVLAVVVIFYLIQRY